MKLHQVFLVMWTLVPGRMSTICKKTSDTLSFSTDIAQEDYVRKGMYEEIDCCANNFEGDVEWSHYKDGVLVKFHPPGDNYVFQQRGQVLIIHEVRMSDDGIFVCTARNSSQNVTFHMHLHVLPCPHPGTRVMPIKVPDPKEYTSVGRKLVLPCLGDFGCDDLNQSRVYWLVKSGKHITQLKGETPFFSVRKITRDNGTILGEELTFKEITPENFTATYTCYLFVPPPYGKPFHVKLEQESTTDQIPNWAQILMYTVVGVLSFAALVIIGVYLWGYQAKYLVMSKLDIGWPKDCDDKKIGLVSASESQEFVSTNIYNYLKDHYDVYYNYESDLHFGEPEATAHLVELEKCSHMILYLTEEEGHERFANFFIEGLPKMRKSSRIIIIHDGNLKKIFKRLNDDSSKLLKVVKKFEWPKHTNKNGRKMNKFWCSVKLCLPAIKKPSEIDRSYRQSPERHSSSSSESALLQDQGIAEA